MGFSNPLRAPVILFRRTVAEIDDVLGRVRYASRVIPPRRLRRGRYIRQYVSGGEAQRHVLLRYGGLTPHADILDVGCGDGRLASALVAYLTDGSYQGFDVNEQFVNYLQQVMGRRRANFGFTHADLWHSYYNPAGRIPATGYAFPYRNESFDIVYLKSVFTHLLPDAVEHYYQEIRRVLRRGGRVVATFFLINEESLRLDGAGLSTSSARRGSRVMHHHFDHYWTRDDDVAERVVGIAETWLHDLHTRLGLQIVDMVYGTWCGRPPAAGRKHQDIVVSQRA